MNTNINNQKSNVGVFFDAHNNKFKAVFDCCGDRFVLGYFSNSSDAKSKRDAFISNFNAVASSHSPLYAFLSLRFPNADTQSLINFAFYTIRPLYFNSPSPRPSFFTFIKNYIIDCGVSCCLSDSPIPTSLPSPLSSFFFYGTSLPSLRSQFHLQFNQLISILNS